MVSMKTLVHISGWAGVTLATSGFILQRKLIDRVRDSEYYKKALDILSNNSGAVHYLGKPIQDKRFKMSDEYNYADEHTAQFKVPVFGPKDNGVYYFWAEYVNGKWVVKKGELELQSKPDSMLVIVKEE